MDSKVDQAPLMPGSPGGAAFLLFAFGLSAFPLDFNLRLGYFNQNNGFLSRQS